MVYANYAPKYAENLCGKGIQAHMYLWKNMYHANYVNAWEKVLFCGNIGKNL
jgi:hypothetical protein